jgi:hypothetical protein
MRPRVDTPSEIAEAIEIFGPFSAAEDDGRQVNLGLQGGSAGCARMEWPAKVLARGTAQQPDHLPADLVQVAA